MKSHQTTNRAIVRAQAAHTYLLLIKSSRPGSWTFPALQQSRPPGALMYARFDQKQPSVHHADHLSAAKHALEELRSPFAGQGSSLRREQGPDEVVYSLHQVFEAFRYSPLLLHATLYASPEPVSTGSRLQK